MRVLDLFSGIGGFSLGLERAGMTTVAFCEIDPFCRRVLAKHWPGVPCYDDVRSLTAERLAADRISVDVICGGFPCQDISLAGNGGGLEGKHSGLWREYARLIDELRPRFVIVENVAALLGRGLDRVLGNLAAIGYDAEWHVISAAQVGAPHLRERLWIIAHPLRQQHKIGSHEERRQTAQIIPSNAYGLRELQSQGSKSDEWGRAGNRDWWSVEPELDQVAYGVSAGVDRLKGLGNAVVPQIPELIGRAIMDAAA